MLSIFKQYFPKDWINKISEYYDILINDYQDQIPIKSINYFKEPGKFKLPSCHNLDNDILEYFNYLLLPPNICILDYLIREKEKFKYEKILDYGAGFGILSIFLAAIGIKCYNYDNFSQVPRTNFHERIKRELNLDITPVMDYYPKETNVILCSGIDLESLDFLVYKDLKYALLDSRLNYGAKAHLIDNFNIIETHGKILSIWERVQFRY